MDPDDLPFKEQLVDLQVPPIVDFALAETNIDASVIYKGLRINNIPLDDLKEIQNFEERRLALTTTLDNSQERALLQALDKKMAIIQGPPGTGKTFIGLKLIELIMSMSTRPSGPVLVLTYKNHALDEFLKSSLVLFPDGIARVGGRSKDPELEAHSLKQFIRKTSYEDSLHQLREQLLSDLEELKLEIIKTIRENHKNQNLQVETMLKNLNDEQIESLIEGCDWSKQKLKLTSIDAEAKMTLVLKSHLEKFYSDRVNHIPKSDVENVLHHCRKAVAEQLKQDKSPLDVDLIASKIDATLNAVLSQEFEEIEYFLFEVNHAISTFLISEKTTLSDIKLLLPGNRMGIAECLLSEEESERVHDLRKVIQTAVKDWLPSKNTFTSVECQFTNRFPLRTSIQVKEKNVNKKNKNDDVEDEDEDVREEEQDRMSALDRQRRGKMEDVIFFEDQHSVYGVSLFLDVGELYQNHPVVGIINTSDLCSLNDVERVILTQVLIAKQNENESAQLDSLLKQYEVLIRQKEELEISHSVKILKSKSVVGMTITGASINIDLLKQLKPAVVLIEEAAEILEPQLLAVLGPWVQQLILIGDHKQLRPKVENYALQVQCNFDVSMMERMIANNMPFESLAKQNRMRPEFAELLKDIYPDLQSNLDRVLQNEAPKCLVETMYFWDCFSKETDERSFYNEGEARRVVALTLFLLRQGYDPDKITILAAYRGQVSLLRKFIRAEEQRNPSLFCSSAEEKNENTAHSSQSQIKVHTIDLYQGDENDIVIISLVRSNDSGNIGFLKELNRRCVAQSRSRCGLYFVGNVRTISFSADWKHVISQMDDLGCVGPSLPLCCPKHRETTRIYAASATEIPNGEFCKENCTEKMPCSLHKCPRPCQPPHQHVRCEEEISFIHPVCRHVCQRFCYQDENSMTCKKIVKFIFHQCGHEGQKKCFEDKNRFICREMVMRTLSCGHDASVYCSDDIASVSCKEPCNKRLPCGHPCIRKCSQTCSEECVLCRLKHEEEQRRREENARKFYNELAEKELEKLEKEQIEGFTRSVLLPKGDTAAEYFEVEDRVKKFIQPSHKWFPYVTKIEKVVNHSLSKQWWSYRKDRMIDPERSELKFHGTSEKAVESILKTGFRLPEKDGMYGKGIYFATDASKSAQEIYTKHSNMLLLCDVLLGKSKTLESAKPGINSSVLKRERYDSVYAKRGTKETGGVLFDEFVVYHPEQALPKYLIHYSKTSCTPDISWGEIEKQALLSSKIRRLEIKQKRAISANDEADLHFRIAESQFLRLSKMAAASSVEVKSVDYYINPLLLRKFTAKSDWMKKKYGDSEYSKYILAFHGTAEGNILSIVKNNFSLAKLSANTGDTGYYGAGIYFSEFPDISLGYGKQLLLCKVLPGKPFDMTRQQLKMGGQLQAGCDSHRVAKDSKGRGDEVVVFDPDQILPCYVIHT